MPWWCLVAIAFALLSNAVGAQTLSIKAARLVAPGIEAADIHLDIKDVEAGSARTEAALRLEIARLDVPSLALRGRMDWSCRLRRSNADRVCSGPIGLSNGAALRLDAELQVRVGHSQVDLELTHADTRVAFVLPFSTAQPLSASARNVPAAWLRAPLKQAWADGELREGMLDLDVSRSPDGDVHAQFSATGLGVRTRDGSVAVQDVAASGQLDWSNRDEGARVTAQTELHGGHLRLNTLDMQLPSTPVAVDLDALTRHEGPWELSWLGWRDPGVLEFSAEGEFDPSAPTPLRSLAVQVERARLPQATERYARSLLVEHGLGALSLKGEVSAEVHVNSAGVQRLALSTPSLDIGDGSGRAIKGFNGAIDWSASGARPATRLAWKQVELDGVTLAATTSRWQSREGALHLLGELKSGVLGGSVTLQGTILDPLARSARWLETKFSLNNLSYDSADGRHAAAQVAVSGQLRLREDDGWPRLQLTSQVLGGEILAGSIYVKLPSTPIDADLDLSLAGPDWQVHAFRWRDPGVLDVDADGVFAPLGQQVLKSLRLHVRQAELGPALQRYAGSWLAVKGYRELDAGGSLSGALTLGDNGIERFSFVANGVEARDGGGRFSFKGVQGSVGWDIRGDRPPSTLEWTSIELFRIPLGGARMQLASRRGAIVLADPLAIDVLGGQWRIEKLSLLPRSPRGERYTASFTVVGIDMGQLSTALGWPQFGGNLSGGIPQIEFSGDTIQLRGGLDLYVFDGRVGVHSLTLERPFGIAPSLGASVNFQNLDLDQVTSAFSFGGMSGRLSGSIADLRLVDWSPVAFDASIRTKGGGRMSYKAVDDITSMGGGGGLSANLQTMALKMFDTFGYSRFGIRCKLRDEVCLMGGIDPIPDQAALDAGDAGYTIVEGSSVPRIMIVGHRRRVDWPTLVRRLEEATKGQGPVIN